MSRFFIKQISVTGEKVLFSEVSFNDGVNIIYGPSNAGKSYIINCINFMFAGDPPFTKSSTGYDTVTMTMESDEMCIRDSINVPTKTTVLGVFDFRAFLNMAMLLSESEKARALRQLMLDIVIDLINRKTGGGTKYINQRDKDFLFSSLQEDNYRRQFTDALKDYVEDNRYKYAHFTDMIYVSKMCIRDSYKPVTGLGDGAFMGNQTVTYYAVTHNDIFTYIGKDAFADSRIEHVDFFDSVTTIGAGAFRNCTCLLYTSRCV